jgi:hypothetical protein
MDNNGPHTIPRYDYGHHMTPPPPASPLQPTSLRPQGQSSHAMNADASVPTASHYTHSPATHLPASDEPAILGSSNVPQRAGHPQQPPPTSEDDQVRLMNTIPATIDRIGYDEREMR